MKKLMYYLMLSCKKATELIEKRTLVKLSFKEKVQLRMHKSMCDACTAYEMQSGKIDELLHKHIHNVSVDNAATLNNEALKETIINNIPNN
ncbi:MAG: hypothetical protein HZB42_12150 [Sphingobacteriales bacterium]|nr:hypothetical protein [Sphingobacteriales bacterium]